MLCSWLLSITLKLSFSPICSRLKLMKLKDSKLCFKAAATIYTFDPLRRFSSARPQDRAAAKLVLMFFRGM